MYLHLLLHFLLLLEHRKTKVDGVQIKASVYMEDSLMADRVEIRKLAYSKPFICRNHSHISVARVDLKCKDAITGIAFRENSTLQSIPTEWILLSNPILFPFGYTGLSQDTNSIPMTRFVQSIKDVRLLNTISTKQWISSMGNSTVAILSLKIDCGRTIDTHVVDFICQPVNQSMRDREQVISVTVNTVGQNNNRAHVNYTTVMVHSDRAELSYPAPPPLLQTFVLFFFDPLEKLLMVQSSCYENNLTTPPPIGFIDCPWSAMQCRNTYRKEKENCTVHIQVVKTKDEINPGVTPITHYGTIPGVLVCLTQKLTFAVEYFFSYYGGIPKLEFSWANIDPGRDMIQLNQPSPPTWYIRNKTEAKFTCKVTKYGFAHTPYFQVTTTDGRIFSTLPLEDPFSEEDAKIFWTGILTYTPTLVGMHRISCIAQAWNTTELFKQFIEIEVIEGNEETSDKGRTLEHGNMGLQFLEETTHNPDSEIYTGPNSATKLDEILNQTLLLLTDALSGNTSLMNETKDQVEAGLGVFFNVARNTPKESGTTPPRGPTILHLIESTLMSLGKKVATDSIQQEEMTIEFSHGKSKVGIVKSEGDDLHKDIYYPSDYNDNVTTYIRVPKEWGRNSFQNVSVVFVGSIVPGRAFGEEFDDDQSTTSNHRKKVLNSDVISFTFSNCNSKDGTPPVSSHRTPVVIVFEHKMTSHVTCLNGKRHNERNIENDDKEFKTLSGSETCAFLNTNTSKWSTEGCRLISSNATKSICECDHLTAFALLMDPYEQLDGDNLALEILTWLVCTFSILGLATTLTIYLILKPKGLRTDIIINLSACLLLGKFCILLLLDRSYLGLGDGFCTFAAILTHYTYLTVFAWMAAEGIQLYRLSIIVFASLRPHGRIQYGGAYGVPALIVLCTGLTAQFKGENAYGGNCFCWLLGDYSWSFFGPALVMSIGNFVVLIVSVKIAIDVRNHKGPQVVMKVTPFLAWVRGIFALAILLGLSWSLGFLMFSKDKTVAHVGAYLFTIFNGLQGVFVFLFHVILNKQIRKGLREKMESLIATNTSIIGFFGRSTS